MTGLLELAYKIELVQTCCACPEQYDAFIDNERIGYLRLRWGYFYVQYTPTSEVIYEADTIGDGMFEDDERDRYLMAARLALVGKHWEETE